jgi:hypothetical protein
MKKILFLMSICTLFISATAPTFKKNLRKKPMRLGFVQKFSDLNLDNLNMIGDVEKWGVPGDAGKISRSLRYKNITNATEKKYGLPSGCLLAMICQESSGADLLPNSSNDGGFGLIHMQPSTARDFGLKTYGNCDELVCKTHATKLRNIIEDSSFDRKKVIKFDDRLHPILNIDAAGRMVAYYMRKHKGKGKFEAAMKAYSGRSSYAGNIKHFMKLINSSTYIKALAKRFNADNTKLTCNGKKIDFNGYLVKSRQQNFNYGLQKYIDHK